MLAMIGYDPSHDDSFMPDDHQKEGRTIPSHDLDDDNHDDDDVSYLV